MKAKRVNAKRKTNGDSYTLVNFRVTAAEKRRCQALARKYMKGNLSKWLRMAGLHFKPKRHDPIAEIFAS